MNKRKKFKDEKQFQQYVIRERVRNRINAKANYDFSKEFKLCYRCGADCLVNLKTGKPYHACTSCRDKENKRIKEFRRVYPHGRNVESTGKAGL